MTTTIHSPTRTAASPQAPYAPMKMFCFPHAGAGVSAFRGWSAPLSGAAEPVPVLLPGRGARLREPRITGGRALFADLLRHQGPPPAIPYLLYGHSLGGLIAYSVTRALERAGRPGPALVVVGACPPPDARTVLADACELPDDRFMGVLERFGAVPQGTERGGVWQRASLDVIRDDLRLARDLRRRADGPLSTTLVTVSGTEDPLAGSEVMAGWRDWADGPLIRRAVVGDHQFLRDRALPLLLGRLCRVFRRLTQS